MNCQVCGFDNTPLDGEPLGTHCAGCGTRISGGDKPFPGRTVDPDKEERYGKDEDGEEYLVDGPDDPIVVDDELREQFPHSDLEDVILVKKATFNWGRGIGMEPDGYAPSVLVTVEQSDDDCEYCGHDEEEVAESWGDAGVTHSITVECARCGNVTRGDFHC
jgi:hypothetical protein